MKRRLPIIAIAIGSLVFAMVKGYEAASSFPGVPRAAPGNGVGKAIFTACVGCHGNSGQGRDYMFAPNLTGQDPAYLMRQLENFRTGKRGKIEDSHGFRMVGCAAAIPGAQGMSAIVLYISALRVRSNAPVLQRPAPTAITKTCAGCHGDAGEGNPALQAPALNRLDVSYIARQLRNFRSGMRGYDPTDAPGITMAASARTVPDDETLESLAEYFGRGSAARR